MKKIILLFVVFITTLFTFFNNSVFSNDDSKWRWLWVWKTSFENYIDGKISWQVLYNNAKQQDILVSFAEKKEIKNIYLYVWSLEWEYDSLFKNHKLYNEKGLSNLVEKLNKKWINVYGLYYLNDDPNNLSWIEKIKDLVQAVWDYNNRYSNAKIKWLQLDQEPYDTNKYWDYLNILKELKKHTKKYNLINQAALKPMWVNQKNDWELMIKKVFEYLDEWILMDYFDNLDRIYSLADRSFYWKLSLWIETWKRNVEDPNTFYQEIKTKWLSWFEKDILKNIENKYSNNNNFNWVSIHYYSRYFYFENWVEPYNYKSQNNNNNNSDKLKLSEKNIPYNSNKFKNVLEKSKLTYPNSQTKIVNYDEFNNYKSNYFYLDKNNNLNFILEKKEWNSKIRNELRQGINWKDNWWKINNKKIYHLKAKVKLQKLTKALEYTFLQIHSEINPLLRIVVKKERNWIKNHIWAVIRINSNSDWVISKSIDLWLVNNIFYDFDIYTWNNKLIIKKDWKEYINEDISYWTETKNYYKAWIYDSKNSIWPWKINLIFSDLKYFYLNSKTNNINTNNNTSTTNSVTDHNNHNSNTNNYKQTYTKKIKNENWCIITNFNNKEICKTFESKYKKRIDKIFIKIKKRYINKWKIYYKHLLRIRILSKNKLVYLEKWWKKDSLIYLIVKYIHFKTKIKK